MSKKPMIFKKRYGVCHICGSYEELTFEHIPPERVFNHVKARVYDGEALLRRYKGNKSKYINMQRGMGKRTLCKKCNNNTGSWYAEAYSNIANIIVSELDKKEPLCHGETVNFKLKNVLVLAFIKQVIAMFCSCIPFEEVTRLGFDKLLLKKDNNYISNKLFDIKMFLTPVKTGQLLSGKIRAYIKTKDNSIDYVDIVDLAAYPFGFILNITPEKEIKYGTSINDLLNNSYHDKTELNLSLSYYERLNEEYPLPMVFKSLSIHR